MREIINMAEDSGVQKGKYILTHNLENKTMQVDLILEFEKLDLPLFRSIIKNFEGELEHLCRANKLNPYDSALGYNIPGVPSQNSDIIIHTTEKKYGILIIRREQKLPLDWQSFKADVGDIAEKLIKHYSDFNYETIMALLDEQIKKQKPNVGLS